MKEREGERGKEKEREGNTGKDREREGKRGGRVEMREGGREVRGQDRERRRGRLRGLES